MKRIISVLVAFIMLSLPIIVTINLDYPRILLTTKSVLACILEGYRRIISEQLVDLIDILGSLTGDQFVLEDSFLEIHHSSQIDPVGFHGFPIDTDGLGSGRIGV